MLKYCVTVFGLVGVWQITAMLLQSVILPTPLEAISHLMNNLDKNFLMHFGVSFYRLLVGLGLGVVSAFPLAIILGLYKKLDQLLYPALYLLHPIPKMIFLPLFLIFFGIGDLSKILMIAVIVFFQTLVAVRDGVKGIHQDYLFSIEVMGATKRQIARHVLIPASLPCLFSSLRISLATSFAVLLLVETYATQTGIGYFIMDAFGRFHYPLVFSGVLVVSGLGLFLFLTLDFLEKKYLPWR